MRSYRPTRRDFLATTSATVLGGALASAGIGRALEGQPLPDHFARSSRSATSFLPDRENPDTLRRFATAAVEAARSAGAEYADVRVAEWQTLRMVSAEGRDPGISTSAQYAFGVRAFSGGGWSFMHGITPTTDGIAQAAKEVARMARNRAALQPGMTLAPAPAVVGEWSTPIQMDPFTVSLQDHGALLNSYLEAAGRVQYGGIGGLGGIVVTWSRETRVFASSEGALTTQHLWYAAPEMDLLANYGMGGVSLDMPGLESRGGGYEVMAAPGFADKITEQTEEIVRWSQLPRTAAFDVGRFPVVMDGTSTAYAFLHTIGSALELDRVLGYEADAAGTSYLGPAEDNWHAQVAAPQLNVMADPLAMSPNKWDDEGVEPKPYPVIRDGRLVDYHTSRDTAPMLRNQYAADKRPVESRGCAMAPTVAETVQVQQPYMAIEPGKSAASIGQLCKDIKRGVLVRNTRWFMMDQQLSSGITNSAWGQVTMLEIVNGKPVRRLMQTGLMFRSKNLWQSLVALGDRQTVQKASAGWGTIAKGQPARSVPMKGSAPAALFKDVNVFSSGADV